MKNVQRMVINYLLVFPEERKVESAVNKVAGTRVASLVLQDFLPNSAGQKEQRAISLSAKQLNHLIAQHGGVVRTKGRAAWYDFATFIGVGKSVAVISYEEHKQGDEYVDTDGVTQKYTMTSTSSYVDAIILPSKVTDTVVELTIQKNINFKEEDDVLAILAGSKPESVVPEGVR